MKKEVLMSLGVMGLLYSSTALSQTCATPPSCASLGFTETVADCAGGKMLKCPFDLSKVFCGGDGSGGDDGLSGAKPGDIYYSDGTVSNIIVSGKTPVGVVAYNEGGHRFVVSLEEDKKEWRGNGDDVACLSNTTREIGAKLDFKGKENTQCLLSDTWSHPAAEYCNNLKPASSGKGSSGWYLPAAGELYAIYLNYSTINNSLKTLSKTQISSGFYWSSSEYDSYNAWLVAPSTGAMANPDGSSKSFTAQVRCVLAF